jgi:NADH-quinone oxidoreductase subunit M
MGVSPVMNGLPLITILTFVPFFGAIVLAAGRSDNKTLTRRFAFGVSLVSLALVLVMWKCFDASAAGFQFEERHAWIPALGAEYRVAVDGLGMLMLLLAAVITPMAILASWRNEDRPHIYFSMVLFLQSGLFGTFTALNFLHWFLFWELSLVPAFFLVRLWGGPQRAAAATQFFVYTMVGSIALLLAFLGIFLATKNGSNPGIFDFTTLAELGRVDGLRDGVQRNLGFHLFGHAFTASAMTKVIFLGALLGFAVKVPLMPFHTWLPATYTEAPSGTTMLLTGVMSKMGVYGFLRILLPIFPYQIQALRTPLLALAVITIIFSASAAFAQRDLKRIFAYSSINHLGYCLLAIFAVATSGAGLAAPTTEKAAALSGVLLQMFNHGLTAATLFWFVALLEKRSGGLRGLHDFGGLRKVAPVFCGLMGIALFSSLGLPGLNGFIGEFLIFKGVFPLAMCSASLSVIGLLVTAIVILTVLQRVFNGPLNPKWSAFPDLTTCERVMLAVPIALMFVLGVYPQLVLGVVNHTVTEMVKQLPF